jgi:hypothetical protein
MLVCPGCGGRNPAVALTCTFCERLLVRERRPWPSGLLGARLLVVLSLKFLLIALLVLSGRVSAQVMLKLLT